MGKLGYRKREPERARKRASKALRQIISFHMKKLGYSAAEMAKLLQLKVASFQDMYRDEILGIMPDGASQSYVW